eukprot:scaffold71725_cov84-Phaeocystis_antarctica.AAC.1
MECAPGSSPSGSATCTTGTNKLPTGCDCTVRTISVNNGNWAKNTGISYTTVAGNAPASPSPSPPPPSPSPPPPPPSPPLPGP